MRSFDRAQRLFYLCKEHRFGQVPRVEMASRSDLSWPVLVIDIHEWNEHIQAMARQILRGTHMGSIRVPSLIVAARHTYYKGTVSDDVIVTVQNLGNCISYVCAPQYKVVNII